MTRVVQSVLKDDAVGGRVDTIQHNQPIMFFFGFCVKMG
jgi:hypothetical protein